MSLLEEETSDDPVVQLHIDLYGCNDFGHLQDTVHQQTLEAVERYFASRNQLRLDTGTPYAD